jgi:hypothetical protein
MFVFGGSMKITEMKVKNFNKHYSLESSFGIGDNYNLRQIYAHNTLERSLQELEKAIEEGWEDALEHILKKIDRIINNEN